MSWDQETMQKAYANLEYLRFKAYPGRMIIVGMTEDGKIVHVYVIMGRSGDSRNRVFKKDESGRLWTAAANPARLKCDPSLILYTAMSTTIKTLDGNCFITTNGDHTDTIIEAIGAAGQSFCDAMFKRKYEPDPPNNTPRIGAMTTLTRNGNQTVMGILRKSPFGDECDRDFYFLGRLEPQIGYCIHTYNDDVEKGQPLHSFDGSPYTVPLIGSPHDIAHAYWNDLDKDNRVALAIKTIDPRTSDFEIDIINQYEEAVV